MQMQRNGVPQEAGLRTDSDSESGNSEEFKTIVKAYSLKDIQTVKGLKQREHVLEYDPDRMSTMCVFCQCLGSVWQSKVLWLEQCGVILICGAMVKTMELFQWHDSAAEDHVRDFAWTLGTLVAFLLGMYTSLTVSRWWRIRTAGVGSVWSGVNQLTFYISNCVTTDEEVLSAIRRYGRASLVLLFLKRRYKDRMPHKLNQLETMNILTAEEVQKLQAWGDNLAESIWSWVAQIIQGLHNKGLITDASGMYGFLMRKVEVGRLGAEAVNAQMGSPIPMPYVQLLSVLVKVNNIVMALSYGYVLGNVRDGEESEKAKIAHYAMIAVKVCFVPLFYNGILVINSRLYDPFDGGYNDFPMDKYQQGIEADSLSYINAIKYCPDWIKDKLE
jgi:predicted membrane chloride channel (bestrophin family)